MKYYIEDKSENVLLSNLNLKCFACVKECNTDSEKVSCPSENKIMRRGKKKIKENIVYLCSSQPDDVHSSKVFKKKFAPYIQLLHQYNNIRENIISPVTLSSKRLVHNVVDLNAKNIQDLDYHFSNVYSYKNYEEQVRFISSKIKELKDSDELATLILDIIKREKMIKFEIATHNKIISPGNAFDKNRASHKLHKVFLNAFYVVSKSLNDFGVKTQIQSSELEAYFDYQSVSVALTHLLNNAEKYSVENGRINISFRTENRAEKNYSVIVIDMISLRITDNDLVNIFNEGYSGEEAIKAKLNGSGIGMWLARLIVNKNGGTIKIITNVDKSLKKNISNKFYENNVFEIFLPAPRQ
jgi:signal transduction histidine kinase